MSRSKKPTYEYVESLKRYRKRIKDSDGKYVAIYGTTTKELETKIAEAQYIIETAKFHRDNPTVKEYAEKWLQMHSIHVRATTLNDYTSIVKNYIIAPLGNRYMCEIRPDDVKLAMVSCSEKSSSVYRKTQMIYKMIFESAKESNIISENPCEKLNPKGGKKAKEKEALNDLQVDTLKESVSGLPVYPFVMLGLYAGLRREEILGLQWKNVSLGGNAPHILVRTAWHIEHNRPVISTELKTAAAKRDIPIPKELQRCLVNLKEKSNSEYVISNSDGMPLSGTQWARMWESVIVRTTKPRSYYRYKDGGRELHTVVPRLGEHAPHNPNVIYSMDFVPTPHQLRHTYITNLLLSGVDVKSVQYLAGHENAKITLDIYTHLTYNRPADLMEKVDNAFSGSTSKPHKTTNPVLK